MLVILNGTVELAKFGDALKQRIAHIEAATEDALQAIGEFGVDALRDAHANHIDTGKLYDSFSWSTSTTSSGVGSAADASDEVSPPTKRNTVHIGTACSYWEAVDKGYGPREVTPENEEELRKNITEWCARHGIPATAVDTIINNLTNNGHVAMPFAEEAKWRITEKAASIIKQKVFNGANIINKVIIK